MTLSRNDVKQRSNANKIRYLDRLSARIDIVREGLSSNPLDVELEEPVTELMKEVRPLIFDKDWVVPLAESEWLVVVKFILSLNEVSTVARKNNRSLNFSAQRSVFVLLGYIFNHPQFSELCGSKMSKPNRAPFIDLVQIMYSEAERQNYDPCSFGDLYAEGEWLNNVMGLPSRKMCPSLNPDGLSGALSLWESLVTYSARSNPNRLTKLYGNLKNAATTCLYRTQLTPIMLEKNQKFGIWCKKLESLKPYKISNLNQCEDAFRVLLGNDVEGEWSEFNGFFGQKSNFVNQTLPSASDIKTTCIQGSALDSIAYFFGICALHNLWAELKQCWYMYQPKDADANYIEYELFKREPDAFMRWINEHVLPMDNKSHERHDLKVHVASACVVILAEMLSSNSTPSFRLVSLEKSERLEQFISLLKSNSQLTIKESVRNGFDWEFSEARSINLRLNKFLDSELARCKKYKVEKLKQCIPNVSILGDRELIYQAWNETNSNFWMRFNHWNLPIEVKCANDIFPNTVEVPFNAGPAYSLSKRSGKNVHGIEFSGIQLAAKLEKKLIQKLKSLPRSTVTSVKKGSMWFISENDSNTGRFNKIRTKYGFNSQTDRLIEIQGEESFIIEKGAVELVIHEWKFMPWSEKTELPVIVYGFTEYDGDITGMSSLHFDLKVLDPSRVGKIDA